MLVREQISPAALTEFWGDSSERNDAIFATMNSSKLSISCPIESERRERTLCLFDILPREEVISLSYRTTWTRQWMCCGIQLPTLFSQEHWSSSGWDFQPIISSWITAALASLPSRVVRSRFSCFRIATSPVALTLSASSVSAAVCTPAPWRMQVGFKFFAA